VIRSLKMLLVDDGFTIAHPAKLSRDR